LAPLFGAARSAGFPVEVLDVGGGFASRTTRELTGRELLLYQGLGRFPAGIADEECGRVEDFAGAISGAVQKIFPSSELPELVCEPGRSIASSSQFLLLTVHHVKKRPGIPTWLMTDGGLGTVTLPTFYEYHEVLLADDVTRPRTETVTIIGPVCFATDIVYRRIRMPRIAPGEVIAIMDSGAYFTALESSFGFSRPAIVSVGGDDVRLVRRAETFADMIGRDHLPGRIPAKEVCHESRSH
jgi:diaminopimelate decarboxylase